MHEKKMSTGVLRIRMNTCTIIGLIILPFLLFMLYVVLFSECTYLLRNSGIYTIPGNAENETSEIDKTTVGLENENFAAEKIILPENYVDENNLGNNIENQPTISIAYRVINFLFLLPKSDEDDSSDSEDISKNESENNCVITTTYDKDDENGESNKLVENSKDIQGETALVDKTTSTSDLEKSLTENVVLPNYEPPQLDDYNPFFGPLFSYGYDSWDFSIPNTLVCPKNGEDLYLMIAIHSNAKNFEQRQAIRETWGRLAKMDGITYAFILSIAADNHTDNRVKHESDQNKDIILTDLTDMVSNESAKSVIFCKWLMYYCPKVKYVFKTNDDVFVNLPQLVMLLKDKNTKDDRMYGFLYEGYKPERDPKKENYVSDEEFESDTYPNYLATEGYIFPAKFVSNMYKTALTLNYMPIENVFITGILAEKLGIPREDIPLYSSTFPDLPKTEKCHIFSYTVVFHPLTADGLRFIWNDLKKSGFQCGYFLENVKKMLPEDKRLYSGVNEKILYPLLTGESSEDLDTKKDNDEKNQNNDLNQIKKSDGDNSKKQTGESEKLEINLLTEKNVAATSGNIEDNEINPEKLSKVTDQNGIEKLEINLLSENNDAITSGNIDDKETNSEKLSKVIDQESKDVPEITTKNEVPDASTDEDKITQSTR